MIGHPILQTQPAEPPIGQVYLHLLAQPALRADRIAVADQKHPDHQLGIDRRAAGVAVIGRQLGPKPAQIESRVDPPKQVISRNYIFQVKLIK